MARISLEKCQNHNLFKHYLRRTKILFVFLSDTNILNNNATFTSNIIHVENTLQNPCYSLTHELIFKMKTTMIRSDFFEFHSAF